MTFNDLGLSKPLLKAISKKGYTEPSVIQEKAIPLVLKRKDLLASAQTGTGKTAGFALPIIQILTEQAPQKRKAIKALVLTPTRELAAQVLQDIRDYSAFTNLQSTVIFGGVNANPQKSALRRGIDILVATPGRLLDLEQQGALSLSEVEILVLDEADRMLDMGFLRDIKRVINLVPRDRQNLLFSATFSKDIKKLANTILKNPVSVEAAPENSTAEKVDHSVYRTDQKQKIELLIELISEGRWQQVLVFTRTKHRANKVSDKLKKAGITSAAIHGNKTQNARTKALSAFKKGDVRVLVATDIAARGLDIPLLPHVINFELPNVAEDYVHRIGRTGRAGASGDAISLVDINEVEYLRGIEKLLGMTLPSSTVEGFEPLNLVPDKTSKKQGGNRGGRNRNQSGGGRQGGNAGNRKPKKPFWKKNKRKSSGQ